MTTVLCGLQCQGNMQARGHCNQRNVWIMLPSLVQTIHCLYPKPRLYLLQAIRISIKGYNLLCT